MKSNPLINKLTKLSISTGNSTKLSNSNSMFVRLADLLQTLLDFTLLYALLKIT